MVTSIVLFSVRRDRVNETAEALAALDGVSEVYSVSGRYDLVAVVRVRGNDDLAELVTSRMLKIEGIESSETMLAFQAFSRHDLEAMFAIGLDE
jgi:DNA-binding Lrp family transcriptional regulator